jgi:polyisoprenoid-binding protein YceI
MLLAFALAAALAGPNRVGADPVTWTIDTVHSEVSFRIRHLVSKVPGTFASWRGTIVADPADLKDASVDVRITTASITTRNERRDAHLRSPDFFAADSFPEISFKSKAVEVSGSSIRITGDLTMRGVTKPVVLTGEYGGTSGPPEPRKQRIGFSVSTKINRLDYGVKYNRAVEGGGMLLGDDVDITINIEAVRT